MNDNWSAAVQNIAVSATVQDARVIGVISPEPRTGVTMLARNVTRVLTRSAVQALLVDLSAPLPDASERNDVARQDQLWHRLADEDEGVPTLIANPTPQTRYLFNNVALLRQTLAEELVSFSKIILDLPPLCADHARAINPLGPAAFCDAVILVCARNRITKPRLDQAVELLRSARVNLAGTVFNDLDRPTPGEEIARTARRFRWAMPGFGRYVERIALNSDMLK
jgi:Mrp family chromosome partitioning ATPase